MPGLTSTLEEHIGYFRKDPGLDNIQNNYKNT